MATAELEDILERHRRDPLQLLQILIELQARDGWLAPATLSALAHKRFTSEETGRLLEDLAGQADQLNPDSDDARLIRVTRHNYDKDTRVPSEKVAEFARVTTVAQGVWARARAENNFALFLPHLQKIIELRRGYASLFAPFDHVYDPLLDDYEPGLKTADVQAIFNKLRRKRLIESRSGSPYRISKRGLLSVRAQLDNPGA